MSSLFVYTKLSWLGAVGAKIPFQFYFKKDRIKSHNIFISNNFQFFIRFSNEKHNSTTTS